MYTRSNWSESACLNSSGRKDLYQQLSNSNGVEQLLYQCMQEGELAWITLKNGAASISAWCTPPPLNIEYEYTANIVLIPMLSGYHDSKTLSTSIKHNYSRWYAEHGITLNSEPKNAMAFRKVLMVDQIENLLLFDSASARALAMTHYDGVPMEVQGSLNPDSKS